jgi:broad specificity phosphatase PhoE
MLIYLRHGDDRGEDAYRHDRRLNDRGRKQAGKKAGQLIRKHGHPDTVFVSPFRRTIETVNCMTARFERLVAVHCDARIAQLLTEKHLRDLSVAPDTLDAIHTEENRKLFQRRVKDHVRDVRARAARGAVIWCITHQVVIEEVARRFEVKISGDLDFLDHVIMLK